MVSKQLIPYDPALKVIEPKWHLEGLMMKRAITGILGAEKTGKSRIIGWLIASMLGQRDCFGCCYKESPGKILYLAGEEPAGIVFGRVANYLSIMDLDQDLARERLDLMEAAGLRLDLEGERLEIRRMLRDGGYNMIVLEPYRRLHAADENASKEVAPILNELRYWCLAMEVDVLLCHHTGKLTKDTDMSRMANWARGSTDLVSILDYGVYVDRLAKDRIQMTRQGRYKALGPLRVSDNGDKQGFWVGWK